MPSGDMAVSLTTLFMRQLLALVGGVFLLVYLANLLLPTQDYFDLLYEGRLAELWIAPHLYVSLMALTGLVVIAVTAWLYSRARHALRHDIKSLARLFQDVRDGSVRVDYPMMLREFSDIFLYLRHSGARLMEEKNKYERMGLLDHLSQLNNRRHFERRLEELFDSARTKGNSSVLIIDMDHFKQVNDQHGHDAGDALIVAFAQALRKRVRKSDFLARLGGDEFCIIYTYTGLDKARQLVERLRQEMPREVSLPREVQHRLRWTGGLSVMDDTDEKFDAVLWRADQALLAAKEAGRNITKVYGDNAQAAGAHRRLGP